MYVYELNSADSLCVNYSKGFVFTITKKATKKNQNNNNSISISKTLPKEQSKKETTKC